MKIPLGELIVVVLVAMIARGDELKMLDSPEMTRGYFYAGSRRDRMALGGFYASTNMPKPVLESGSSNTPTLTLCARTDQPEVFEGAVRGYRVLLINRTTNEYSFPACDSRLYLVQQAKDTNGIWRNTEALPTSFCGNSLHNVFLPPSSYWEFIAPHYTGSYRTRLRFALLAQALHGIEEGEEIAQDGTARPAYLTHSIYSNEFEGYINPGLFSCVPKIPSLGDPK